MFDIWKNVSWVLPYRSDFLTPIMKGFTFFGNDLFLFFFLTIGFWIWRKETFRRLIILEIITILLNSTLKDWVQDPRPDAIYHLIPIGGYGFPSGHAQIAMTLWIPLAIEINRPLSWVICGILAFGMAFSRIYLGVHDLEDVTAGLAIGALTVYFFYKFKEPLSRFAKKLILPAQLFILWVFAALWLVIYPGEIGSYILYGCSLLIAQGSGLILEDRYIHFSPSISTWRRMVSMVFGLTMLILIVIAFRGMTTDYIKGPLLLVFFYAASISLCQTLVAPYLFARLKLVDRKY